MSVHGFVKMIEFWLLKFQENGKNKQQQLEIQRVSKHLFKSCCAKSVYVYLTIILGGRAGCEMIYRRIPVISPGLIQFRKGFSVGL